MKNFVYINKDGKRTKKYAKSSVDDCLEEKSRKLGCQIEKEYKIDCSKEKKHKPDCKKKKHKADCDKVKKYKLDCNDEIKYEQDCNKEKKYKVDCKEKIKYESDCSKEKKDKSTCKKNPFGNLSLGTSTMRDIDKAMNFDKSCSKRDKTCSKREKTKTLSKSCSKTLSMAEEEFYWDDANNKCIATGISYVKDTVRNAVKFYKKGFTNPKIFDNIKTAVSNYIWIVDYTDCDPEQWKFIANRSCYIEKCLCEICDARSFYKQFVTMIKTAGDCKEQVLVYDWQSCQQASYVILTCIEGKNLAFGAGFFCKSATGLPSIEA